jgi:hypothetical protein
MTKVKSPFPLKLSWQPDVKTNYIYGNKEVVEVFVDGLEEILSLYSLYYIQKYDLDYYGGCYNNRLKRGKAEPSTHSWGIAIDYIPNYGPYHEKNRVPCPIVDVFKKRGFIWGGDWIPEDGMHWQACRGY